MEEKVRLPTEEEQQLLLEVVRSAKEACSGSDALALLGDFTDALRKGIFEKFGDCDLSADGMRVDIIKKTPDDNGLHMKTQLYF